MRLKQILPYEKYVLESSLPPAEIGKRISDVIEPKKTAFFAPLYRKSARPYEGQYVGDRFEISRIIDYRNSFLPDISGHIISFGNQTRIAINMQLSPFVLVFMAGWLGIVGLVCLSMLTYAVVQSEEVSQREFTPLSLMPFGMFIFGCLLAVIPFKIESKKSKQFLASLFEGQEVKEL